MTDVRSQATREADLHDIAMSIEDIDLGEIASGVSTHPVMRGAGVGRVEFVAPDGTLIVAVDSDEGVPAVGMGRVLGVLARTVAGDAGRQYIEAAQVMAAEDPATLRIAVRLTPVTVTLPGIEAGLYGIGRLQLFAMAYESEDVEALPNELGEAVARVREMLA